MRRDKNDEQWQECKRKVIARDKNKCQLIAHLTTPEYNTLNRNAPRHLLSILDPAHCIAVSEDPTIMYDVSNVWTVNRYSHENLDNLCSPIDGHRITKEEQEIWWRRIKGLLRKSL
jgi:hypothetical protein